MFFVTVQITRFVDKHFPGFVECMLIDAYGRSHLFIDKVPVVSNENLGPSSQYPCDGGIRCTIETEYTDERGRLIVKISTEYPDHVDSIVGDTHFVMLASQVQGR